MSLAETIIHFLTERRGQTFCTECIALKVRGARELASSAILEAEGRGARRVHGRCSVCGKERLVAGVS